MNTPYKWYNTNTETLKSTGNSWNYEVTQGAYYQPPYPEMFVLSPDTATYTRGKNGEYIYTITCVNAKILADFVDNKTKVYHFEKDHAPTGQRSVDFFKSTEDHKKDLTFLYDNDNDIHVVDTYTESINGTLDHMYFTEMVYPSISHYLNVSYWNYSSKIATFPINYYGDRTTYVDKSELSDYWTTFQLHFSHNMKTENMLLPGNIRIFRHENRHIGSIREYIIDSWVSNTDSKNIFQTPYGCYPTIRMSSYTYPKNYALDQFVIKYPECAPANKYDQDEILRKLTWKCADDLKAKNSKTKVYVVKYRKQSSVKSFPIYLQSCPDESLNDRHIYTSDISCDYSYLDSCASGSDYIYDCSSPEELETVMSKIAERVKQEAGYTTAHCESVN